MRGVFIGLALIGLNACSQQQPASSAAPAESAAPAPAPTEAPAPPSFDVSKLEAPYNTADAEAGERTFNKCRACHAAGPGAPNMVGPSLHGLFGRKAGTHEGFVYSDAMANAGFTWTPAKLNEYITDPKGTVPGNRMTFIGVKDPTERQNLIAYLMLETNRQ